MNKYESPIQMVMDRMRIETENEIMKAVQGVGITVDKDELVKALDYDRNQYGKGYNDGFMELFMWMFSHPDVSVKFYPYRNIPTPENIMLITMINNNQGISRHIPSGECYRLISILDDMYQQTCY